MNKAPSRNIRVSDLRMKSQKIMMKVSYFILTVTEYYFQLCNTLHLNMTILFIKQLQKNGKIKNSDSMCISNEI